MKEKIFVSAGTHSQGFERLIKKIDEIASKKEFEFFAQTGNTGFSPEYFEFRKFLSPMEMERKIDWADLIICHGGAGILGPGISKGKKIIVAPRLKELNEHTDNHQLELGKAVEKEYSIKCITDLSGLEQEIKKELPKKPAERKKENRTELIVAEFIEKQEEKIMARKPKDGGQKQ